MEITEIGILGIKAESTYGTDPVPTVGSNLIPTTRDSLSWTVESTPVRRKALDGTLEAVPGFNSMPNVTLKFRYELRGNRTDGTAADISSGSVSNKIELDSLLGAAHLVPSYVAASGGRDGSVGYSATTLQTGIGPSVTCYWWTATKLHKLLGGKADLDFVWEAGQVPYMEVTVRGKYVVPADTTFPSGLTYVLTKPQIFEAGGFVFGGYNGVIQKAEYHLGNQIALRSDPTDSTGVAGFVITGCERRGSFDPEAVPEATNPFWSDWRAATSKSHTITTPYMSGTSATSGNGLVIVATIEPKSINYANRNNLRTHQYEFDIVKSDIGALSGGGFVLRFR